MGLIKIGHVRGIRNRVPLQRYNELSVSLPALYQPPLDDFSSS